MRRLASIYMTLLLVVYASAAAAQTSKAPWEWSVEERLAERLDQTKVVARERAYEETIRAHHSARVVNAADAQLGAQRDSIDGKRNPELFFPHELFDGLLTGLTPDQTLRRLQRDLYGPGIRALQYDEERFWSALESIASEYLVYRFVRTSGGEEYAQARCRLRYESLQQAYGFYGREKFLRLLYTVVAPTSQHAASSSRADMAAALQRQASGCQP
jgi:hypothetical protein